MTNTPFFLCITSLFCMSVYADTNPANPNRIDYLEATVNDLQKQVSNLKASSGANVINPPAGPQVNGSCDFYITGELLCWRASETGLEYAVKAKTIDPNTVTLGNGSVAKPHFDWDLGFRVGIGWNTNHDNWDLYLSWTRIHTAAHGHRHAKGHSLFSLLADNFYADRPSIETSAYLKIHLNNVNLELGRDFYVGKKLSFRPHIGLENIWISQHYYTKYHGHPPLLTLPEQLDSFNNVSFRNNFWGIGIRAGLETGWEMRGGLSIYGNVAWSLLYGDFDIKRTSKISDVLVSKAHLDENLTQGCASMDFALGLQWDCTLASDRFHLGLRMGWEEHIYFEQNHMFNFVWQADGASRAITPNSSLTFQGFTTSVRIDF